MHQAAHTLPDLDALEIAARGLTHRGPTGLCVHDIQTLCLFAQQTAGALTELILLSEENIRSGAAISGPDVLNLLHRHGLYAAGRAEQLRSDPTTNREIPHGEEGKASA